MALNWKRGFRRLGWVLITLCFPGVIFVGYSEGGLRFEEWLQKRYSLSRNELNSLLDYETGRLAKHTETYYLRRAAAELGWNSQQIGTVVGQIDVTDLGATTQGRYKLSDIEPTPSSGSTFSVRMPDGTIVHNVPMSEGGKLVNPGSTDEIAGDLEALARKHGVKVSIEDLAAKYGGRVEGAAAPPTNEDFSGNKLAAEQVSNEWSSERHSATVSLLTELRNAEKFPTAGQLAVRRALYIAGWIVALMLALVTVIQGSISVCAWVGRGFHEHRT